MHKRPPSTTEKVTDFYDRTGNLLAERDQRYQLSHRDAHQFRVKIKFCSNTSYKRRNDNLKAPNEPDQLNRVIFSSS